MDVALVPVALADKAELRAMLDPYLIAHADLVDPARVHGDPTEQPHFDLYWTEPGRIPLWIVADGARAGFLLLNDWSPSGLEVDRAISEFCVAPAFRRTGVGAAAALAAFASQAGCWELQVYRANPAGMAFWARVLAAAPTTDRHEITDEDRIIHRFLMP